MDTRWWPGPAGRRIVILLAAALAVGSAAPSGSVPDVGAPGDSAAVAELSRLAAGLRPASADDDPVAPARATSAGAPLARSTPASGASAVRLPVPGTRTVALGRDPVAAGDGLTIAAGSAAGAGAHLRVQVLDRSAAERVGAAGFAFTVAPGGGPVTVDASMTGAAPVRAALPVRISVDYAAFAELYGAGFADRMRVVALAPCTAEPLRPDGCDTTATPVPTRVDAAAARLVADAVLPPDGATALFAVTAGPSGETGNFGATPLSAAAGWQVAPGSGEFSWSYRMPVPPPPYGTAPTVGLSYSSGAIDGLVSTGNTQGGQTGVGWSDFAGSFIERRYTGCEATVPGSADLCWLSHNATISLNGRASELVALDAHRTQWRLKSDPGWLVEAIPAGADNGDDDREAWRVTTPDGTRYFFGLGRNPDTGASTESVWTVPVFADHAGEPCRGTGNTLDACDQAWRWNLDRVVEPNGVVTTYSYVKERNHYRALGGFGNRQHPYIRAGRLARIEYGKPQGTGTEVSPAARVVFEAEYRCRDLAHTCPEPTRDNGAQFPDVPVDLLCTSDCAVMTPTFFSTKRYSAVRTEVYVGGGWRTVQQFNLQHGWSVNTDNELKLGLNGIQRVGLSGGTLLPLPAVNFLYTELPNRVDVNLAAGRRPMGHFRLTLVVNEYGGRTAVTHAQPNQCAASYAGPWDTNGRDCFPQKLGARFGVFHKYLTSRVEQQDPTGGSPSMVTTYAYEGAAAWHHSDDEYTPSADQSWSDWRGYATTVVATGSSRKKVRLLRGMHGDRLAGGGVRAVTVEPFDGAGFDAVPAVQDEPWLAGATLVEARLGALGEVTDASLHEYEIRVTARAGNDPQDWAAWLGERRTTANIAGGVGTFVQERSGTTYNAFFQPETVFEEGRLDRTGDERCVRTTYAVNGPAGLVDRPSGVTTLAGTCASGTVLAQRETYYDGSTTLGAVTKGNPTRQRVRLDGTRWVTTADTAYDAFGRVSRVTDAAGLVVTTAHEGTPRGGYPTVSTVTRQVGGVAHTTSTQWLPEYGAPLATTDANGNVTTYGYDGLGRLWRVRQPTEQPNASGKPPSWEFFYDIADDRSAPPVVHSRRVQSADLTRFEDEWLVYDSFGRQRQRQVLSPQSGKVVVTGTSYNGQGLVEDETLPQAVTGTPGTGLLAVSWTNRVRTTYDALGRVGRQGWYRGGTEQWATVTSYNHDTTTVRQPDGRSTRTVTDGLGRTVRTEQFDGTGWLATGHEYDLADRLLAVTDPAGNRTTFAYNLAGWRTATDSPDSGARSYTYDDAGRVVSATDGAGAVTWNGYDVLGRPVERREAGPAGPVTARWAYDAPGEKGLLDRTTRVTDRGSWVVDVTGYDGRGRPLGTQWTVPASAGALTGTYTVGLGYDRADHVTSVSYPAVGGLPAETVTTRYNSAGLPETMTGIDAYVWSAAYDDRGRPDLFGLGPRPGGDLTWLAKRWTYDADQRPDRMQALMSGSIMEHQFGYDTVGHLTSRTTVTAGQFGAQNWRECYDHDTMARLVAAYTTTAAGCDGSARGTGAQPYDHTYAYSPDGNLTARTENGIRRTYTYGADRPHAPTAVGTDTYAWNANGGLAARTVGGRAETLEWDSDRRLTGVTGPAGDTTFVYDADGNRLLRTTSQGQTLFIAGHEIAAAGANVRATRHYGFDGRPVAVRTPSTVDYLVTDQQGSVEASLPAGGAVAVSRTYTPYGKRRSGGELGTDRGWLGRIEDDTTGLNHLGARYYDPDLGRFLSPDPVYNAALPQTLNAYHYGLNSPTSATDASGLTPCWAKGGKMGFDCDDKKDPNPGGKCQGLKCGTVKLDTGGATVGYHRPPGASYDPPSSGGGGGGGGGSGPSGGGSSYDAAQAAREHRDRMTLLGLHRANPDPAFWFALALAGSGPALVLHGLKAGNPDPKFWFALHQAGSGANLVKIAKNIQLNKQARPFRSMGKTTAAAHDEDDGEDGEGGLLQDVVDNMNCGMRELGTGGRALCGSSDPTEPVKDWIVDPPGWWCVAMNVAGGANAGGAWANAHKSYRVVAAMQAARIGRAALAATVAWEFSVLAYVAALGCTYG